jgi:hypothetical protein
LPGIAAAAAGSAQNQKTFNAMKGQIAFSTGLSEKDLIEALYDLNGDWAIPTAR